MTPADSTLAEFRYNLLNVSIALHFSFKIEKRGSNMAEEDFKHNLAVHAG